MSVDMYVPHFATDAGPECPVCSTPDGRGVYSYRTTPGAEPYLVAHCHVCYNDVRLPIKLSDTLTLQGVVLAHRYVLRLLRDRGANQIFGQTLAGQGRP